MAIKTLSQLLPTLGLTRRPLTGREDKVLGLGNYPPIFLPSWRWADVRGGQPAEDATSHGNEPMVGASQRAGRSAVKQTFVSAVVRRGTAVCPRSAVQLARNAGRAIQCRWLAAHTR
jgi:hypothetical protein